MACQQRYPILQELFFSNDGDKINEFVQLVTFFKIKRLSTRIGL